MDIRLNPTASDDPLQIKVGPRCSKPYEVFEALAYLALG